MDFSNKVVIVTGGAAGILLGLIVALVGGVITIFADKLTGGSGGAGVAISSTAASAVATPAAMAQVDPTLAALAPIATPQIAASVIVTAILTPIMTSWVAKANAKKSEEVESK